MFSNPSLPSASLISPQALMSIQNLELRARVVVEGFWNGIHRSPYHGFSVEFTEYRQYTTGDDPRYLDWRVLARSDRYFIKKFEDETNLRCHLVTDQSRSMTYGSVGYHKAQYAATLAATLKRIVEIIRKRSLVIVLSDFLAPIDRVEPQLTSLAACGHEVIVFQILDPAELNFTFES